MGRQFSPALLSPLAARNVVTVGPIPVMAPSFCASLSFSSRRSVFAEYFYAYVFLHLLQASFSVFSEHFNTHKRAKKLSLDITSAKSPSPPSLHHQDAIRSHNEVVFTGLRHQTFVQLCPLSKHSGLGQHGRIIIRVV